MIRIGIQGDSGSTNERAAKHFASKRDWTDCKILPLRTTEKVLSALHEGSIDFGTFAWESSRAGLVQETQEAMRKFTFQKLDEVKLQIDHCLLSKGQILENNLIRVFSHPQAIKEHRGFLEKHFQEIKLHEEVDTAYAANKLQSGDYPTNSIVIAPKACAEIYGLDIYFDDLPSNMGYWTKIFLVSKDKML